MMMTGVGWSLVEVASQLLERDEREAVLGDLVEAGKNASQGLLDVLGLIIRRQTALEELATMACGVWTGITKQLSSYGLFALR